MCELEKSLQEAPGVYATLKPESQEKVKAQVEWVDAAINSFKQADSSLSDFGDLSSICVNPDDHKSIFGDPVHMNSVYQSAKGEMKFDRKQML